MNRHTETMRAVRSFWRLLLRHDINFSALAAAFQKVEDAKRFACKTYQMVMERHPYNVKLLRSYASFLEEAMNDPWRAQRYYT